MIAPCGMNCAVCVAHLREKNKCPGCRGADDNKPVTRVLCKTKTCESLAKAKFCFECLRFPCVNLKHLDKRYTTKYGMRMIENLEHIKKEGIGKFIINGKKRWFKHGKIFCVHDKKFYTKP